jgi:hypothetical protein
MHLLGGALLPRVVLEEVASTTGSPDLHGALQLFFPRKPSGYDQQR